MSWLPEDYKEPSTSNYMQFEMGENTFRVLDKPVMGIEYWVTVEGKRKPRRVLPDVSVPIEELEDDPTTGEMEIPKFFWAFPVYNYLIDKIQILEIKQKTIRTAMQSYLNNVKWGDPIGYTFIVTKAKEGGKTSYSVAVDPKEELPKEIVERYRGMHINLNALFDGSDPFMASKPKEPEVITSTADSLDKDIEDIMGKEKA